MIPYSTLISEYFNNLNNPSSAGWFHYSCPFVVPDDDNYSQAFTILPGLWRAVRYKLSPRRTARITNVCRHHTHFFTRGAKGNDGPHPALGKAERTLNWPQPPGELKCRCELFFWVPESTLPIPRWPSSC